MMQLRFAWKPLLVQSQLIGLLVLAQFQTSMWTTHAAQRLTLDRMFLYFLLFAGVNFVVIAAGDGLARKMGWWQRTPYLLIGAAASTVAHVVALAPGGYVEAWRNGVIALILAIPLLLGAATAFLMHRGLGYSTEGDDPQALAAAAMPRPLRKRQPRPPSTTPPRPAITKARCRSAPRPWRPGSRRSSPRRYIR